MVRKKRYIAPGNERIVVRFPVAPGVGVGHLLNGEKYWRIQLWAELGVGLRKQRMRIQPGYLYNSRSDGSPSPIQGVGVQRVATIRLHDSNCIPLVASIMEFFHASELLPQMP